MKHIGDDEMHCQALQMLWEGKDDDHARYLPFSKWQGVDSPAFTDLVRHMTSLDPTKRITAVEAFEHPWFADP